MATARAVHIHVHIEPDQVDPRISEILSIVRSTNTRSTEMALDLSALTTEVEQNSDVTQSAITLLNSIAQQLRDASGDPAAIEALADSLDSNSSALAAAVAANTPTPPTPDPEPVPDSGPTPVVDNPTV